jgi:hypothetical protein
MTRYHPFVVRLARSARALGQARRTMRAGQWLVWAALPAAALGCLVWLASCTGSSLCFGGPRPMAWEPALMAGAASLTGLGGLAWVARTVWLLRAGRRLTDARLGRAWPPALHEAVARTGAGHVLCLAVEAPLAFCVGALRPRVVVSSGLVDILRAQELDAVLLHEEHHRRRRDPLRRVALKGAADVLFALPLVEWWMRRSHERSELAADRAAIDALGPGPVAGALWRLDSAVAPPVAAAFGGVAQLRASQLLGDPIPARRLSLRLCASSAVGAAFVALLAACVGQGLISL